MQKKQITVVYGEQPREMVVTLLTRLRPEEGLPRNAKIGLKPNLVLEKPASSGATTHPELVEGIIQYFQAKGYQNLLIMEGSWVGSQTQQAFRVCGYRELA
ncbi:MAG TPA: iron-sulfur cluster-binding protein, partial [Firmicutes bacterium]|nr:iron-sulfur cluster-binding protein [Bacillota bacterium]